MRPVFSRFGLAICLFSFSVFLGCSTAVSKTADASTSSVSTTAAAEPLAVPKIATIEIKPNSPADTVRAFCVALREKRFREALFLTNLRPAVESLTDMEMKEFQVDFESIARYVPSEVQINGEIITGSNAIVTVMLPNKDLDKNEVQEIRLRKDGETWVILTVDESAESKIKKLGKNYFPALRIDSHEDDARAMLDRVAKAEMAFAAQNQGNYGDMNALIAAELLPADIRSSESTGYSYTVTITGDKKRYSAAATPAVYGKTGKLTFMVELDTLGQPHLVSRDDGAVKKTK
jgi:hypothetical protein